MSQARLGRRELLALGGSGLLTASLAACGSKKQPAAATTAGGAKVPERNDANSLTWKEARKRLEEGNARFAEGRAAFPDQSRKRREGIGAGKQRPFVSVLSCADSRVPPELVFDQGLGDLFVVRSAGQVLDSAVTGTLQFGIAEFGTPLLVVLGHTNCGAVKATIEALEKKQAASGTDIDALVGAIAPAVREAEELGAGKKDLVTMSVDANVERVVEQLSESKIISVALKSRKLRILGAVYDLVSGDVEFL
jgi:carbonic anhydrase